MEFTSQIIPEVVNNFNVYDASGSVIIGITDEMTLADLANKVATVTGAGISGSYNVPIVGHYDSITQEVPFRVLYTPVMKICNPMKVVTLNMRGAIQVTNKGTGTSDFAGIRYVVKGRPKQLSPGSLKPGDVMGTKVQIECTYVLFEIDGKKLVEVDKLNSIFRIEGVDYMEKLRKLC
ncbi:phage major tail tube protein [Lachnospiraceae bacterium 45-P1]